MTTRNHRQPSGPGSTPRKIVDTRRWCRPIQDRLFCADGRANLAPQLSKKKTRGGGPVFRGAPRHAFLLHNDLAFPGGPSHDGPARLHRDGGGFFSAQRNGTGHPSLWLEADPACPIFALAVLRHFEQCGNRKLRNKEPADVI